VSAQCESRAEVPHLRLTQTTWLRRLTLSSEGLRPVRVVRAAPARLLRHRWSSTPLARYGRGCRGVPRDGTQTVSSLGVTPQAGGYAAGASMRWWRTSLPPLSLGPPHPGLGRAAVSDACLRALPHPTPLASSSDRARTKPRRQCMRSRAGDVATVDKAHVRTVLRRRVRCHVGGLVGSH